MKQQDKEMFGENNEGGYVLANIIGWVLVITGCMLFIYSIIIR